MNFESCRDAVRHALRYWNRESRAGNPLSSLQLFAQYRRQAASDRIAANQLLLDTIDELAKMHVKEAILLKERYVDGMTVAEVASKYDVAVSTLYNWQHNAISHLAEIVHGQESQLEMQESTRSLFALPPLVDDYLTGLTFRADPLLPLLQRQEAPWMMLLTGLGGIGKSTLALHLAHRLNADETFAGALCLNVRESPLVSNSESCLRLLAERLLADEIASNRSVADLLTIMAQYLQRKPRIFVIDHLEHVPDSALLLTWLPQIAQPSVVLATTRKPPQKSYLFHQVRMTDLPKTEAVALIRTEAQRLDFFSLANAPETELTKLYKAVGGHPLALRVMVGEIGNFGLSEALSNLARGRGQAIMQLYDSVFGEWPLSFDSTSTQLLRLIAGCRDMTLPQLVEATGTTNRETQNALTRLIEYNVVTSAGDFTQRTYNLNRLARSYLQAVSGRTEAIPA